MRCGLNRTQTAWKEPQRVIDENPDATDDELVYLFFQEAKGDEKLLRKMLAYLLKSHAVH
jgi:hypothetical protein